MTSAAVSSSPTQDALAEQIRWPLLLLFSLPNIAIGVAWTAMSVVLPGFYAKYTAAGLGGVAAGLLVARILEVVTDLSIGHLSDITRGRLGARKPWLIVGAIVAPVGAVYLFAPPRTAGPIYFAVCTAAAYLTWTMINIPYRAWAVGCRSRDYDQRSKIFTMLGVAQVLGAIAFAAAPFLPIFATTQMRPDTMERIGLGLACAFPITLVLAIAFVPSGRVIDADRPSLASLFGAVRGNKPLQRFLIAYMLGGVAQSAVTACFFFYADTYLRLGRELPLALVIVYVGGFVGMPVWLWAMLKLGKPKAWAVGYALIGMVGLTMACIPPGAASAPVFLAICAAYGFVSTVDVFAPLAVLGDVIDYDDWKTGANRAGVYNALAALLQKANYALGGAMAFGLLGLVGYDVSGRHTNGPQENLAFLFVFAGVPALFYIACALTIWGFPLDKRRQTMIRRRLERRLRRQALAALARATPGRVS